MVGRTPEYLGKKIEAYDVQMAMLSILVMTFVILGFSALAVVKPYGASSISNPGPHGLSQVLYIYTSSAGNNGSAFAGLNGNTLWYNTSGAAAMLLGPQRQHALVQHERRGGNAARQILHGDSGARHCGQSRPEEDRSGIGRHISGKRRPFQLTAGWDHRDRGRTHVFSGVKPGPHSRTPDDAGGQSFLRTYE
jgi:hypothetical protein